MSGYKDMNIEFLNFFGTQEQIQKWFDFMNGQIIHKIIGVTYNEPEDSLLVNVDILHNGIVLETIITRENVEV